MVGYEIIGCLDRIGGQRSGIGKSHHVAGEASIDGEYAG